MIDDFFLILWVDVDNVFLKLIIKNNINYFKYFLLLNKKMICLQWMEKKLLPCGPMAVSIFVAVPYS